MVNISANGFAFSCTDEVFADAKGKEIAISIPDFSIVSARNLTGVIIRSSNNDGEYIVGCRMPEDHLQIKEYIEHREAKGKQKEGQKCPSFYFSGLFINGNAGWSGTAHPLSLLI